VGARVVKNKSGVKVSGSLKIIKRSWWAKNQQSKRKNRTCLRSNVLVVITMDIWQSIAPSRFK
jgi:hypothetical protein